VFLAWAPAAFAWSWPVQGPVLQPFSYDAANPYAAGQHRGIDVGADSAGETVVAPAAGVVSFAGTVAANGKTITIQTPDGYSVTLTHLGSTLVAKGATVAERDAIGTIGPSGAAEVEGPYVHLGIRVTTDPEGYLDPLSFLPAVATGADGGSTSSQPGSSSSSSTATGGAPSSTGSQTPPATHEPGRSHAHGSRTSRTRTSVSSDEHARVQDSRPDARPAQPAQHHLRSHESGGHIRRPAVTPTSSSRRPVVEPAAPAEPIGLDAGHEISRSAPVSRQTPTVPMSLVLNGSAALVALAAAFAASRSRRRRHSASPGADARVLQLPPQFAERRPASRAA